MIDVSNDFKKACKAKTREGYLSIQYGLFNSKIKSFISISHSNEEPFSNTQNLYDDITISKNYISCEPNRVILDGSYFFIVDKTKINKNQNIAYWSLDVSGESGYFIDDNPDITFSFSEPVSFTNLIIYFKEIAEEFDIIYSLNNSEVATARILNNNSLVYQSKLKNVSSKIDKIRIMCVKTKKPYRRIKIDEINFGEINLFQNTDIQDIDIINEASLDNSDIIYNSANITIIDKNNDFDILNPNNKLSILKPQSNLIITYYLKVNGVYQSIPLGTFGVEKITNENKKLKISSYDTTYYINKIYTNSQMYMSQTIDVILKDLFNFYNIVNYKIDDSLTHTSINGYIPCVSFREALRLVCESQNAFVYVDAYGTINIKAIQNTSVNQFNKNDDLLYKEIGNYQQVKITKYNYSLTPTYTTTKEIFNSTDALQRGTHILQFSEVPVKSIKSITINSIEYIKDTSEFYNAVNIVHLSATAVKLELKINANTLSIKGEVFNITTTTELYQSLSYDEETSKLKTISNNPLIDIINVDEVAHRFLNLGNLNYTISHLSLPYIELGDLCTLDTGYTTHETSGGESFTPIKVIKKFNISKTEFTKSIKETLEGK